MSRKLWKNCISLLTVLLLCACGAAPAAPTETPKAPTETLGAALPAPQPPGETVEVPAAETEVPAPPAAPTPDVTPQPPQETPEPTPEPFSPLLTAGEAVADEHFSDTAFLGNSLVRGLELYGGLKNADFYAVTSTSVINIGVNREVQLENGETGTLLQALAEKQYGKIYILLGVNEISFETDYFIELYGQLLDTIGEQQPDAEIYIMGLTPVTEEKSGEGDLFAMARVNEYNAALTELAAARGCWYVDLVDALADESGYLPKAESTDGIHLQPGKYPDWADYLRTHYPQSPEQPELPEETEQPRLEEPEEAEQTESPEQSLPEELPEQPLPEEIPAQPAV